MSQDFAHISLKGRLTRDVSTSATSSGEIVANASLAVNEYKEGEASFYNLAFFGRLAEVASQHLRKGSAIIVGGRPKVRSYTGRDGGKRQSFEINVRDFDFAGPRQEAQPAERPQPPPFTPSKPAPRNEEQDDDLPF